MHKFQDEFKMFTGFDDRPKSKAKFRKPASPPPTEPLLQKPVFEPVFTNTPFDHSDGDLWAKARKMLEVKPKVNATAAQGEVGFKRVKLPTLSLKEEFGSKFEESFELGFGETMFDLFLDDMGERDTKLVDVGNNCAEEGLQKFDSIVRDSERFVN